MKNTNRFYLTQFNAVKGFVLVAPFHFNHPFVHTSIDRSKIVVYSFVHINSKLMISYMKP